MINYAIANIFYNSRRDLQRLVDSIPKGSIKTFLAIDGVYSFNYCKDGNLSGLSIDGSRELLKEELGNRKGIEVHIEDCPNETEFIKRNRYLELCKKYNVDVLLIIDSDEYFYYEGNNVKYPNAVWDLFKENFKQMKKEDHNVYSLSCILSDGHRTSYPRVWYKPHEMRYFRNSHYYYLNIYTEYEKHKDDKYPYIQQNAGVIQGLTIKHDHTLRNDIQMKMRKDYKEYLVRYEELVQRKVSHEEAHKEALRNPFTEFKTKCPCSRCSLS